MDAAWIEEPLFFVAEADPTPPWITDVRLIG